MRHVGTIGKKDIVRPAPGRDLVKMALVVLFAVMFLLAAGQGSADDRKTRVISLLSSGQKTGTGQSTAFDVSAYAEGQVFIDVTAEGGVSTLDITVQTSPDNTTWYTHTTVGQISATGETRAVVTNFGNYLRINYVVGGTSFTFSITGVFKN